MKRFEWHDNCRLYKNLQLKAKRGNPVAQRLVKAMKLKYSSVEMKEKYQRYHLQELHKKACAGNVTAWQILNKEQQQQLKWEEWILMIDTYGVQYTMKLLGIKKPPIQPDFPKP